MDTQLKANLFIPGTGKSGTSSLHLYLNQHPQISMSDIKETHFFCMEETFRKGFDYYNSLFPDKKNAQYYGESCTSYIGSDIAIERIKKYSTNPKFIIVLRNPIDRVYSHYTWLAALNKEHSPLKEAVIKDMDSVFDPNKPLDNYGYKHYLYFSKYGTLVEKYIASFGKENIHIVLTEKLKSAAVETVNECFTFLNLSNIEQLEEVKENITSEIKRVEVPSLLLKLGHLVPKPFKDTFNVRSLLLSKYTYRPKSIPFSKEDRIWLYELLKDEVLKLKKITGYEYKEWPDFNIKNG